MVFRGGSSGGIFMLCRRLRGDADWIRDRSSFLPPYHHRHLPSPHDTLVHLNSYAMIFLPIKIFNNNILQVTCCCLNNTTPHDPFNEEHISTEKNCRNGERVLCVCILYVHVHVPCVHMCMYMCMYLVCTVFMHVHALYVHVHVPCMYMWTTSLYVCAYIPCAQT